MRDCFDRAITVVDAFQWRNKKKEEEGKEEEEKRGKRESGEKNQRYQTTNGVESTWEEGEGIAVGSRFSGVN